MKELSKKVQAAKYNLEIEQKKKEREEWLASLTDEERAKYYADKEAARKRRQKALLQFLALTSQFNGPYHINGGRK